MRTSLSTVDHHIRLFHQMIQLLGTVFHFLIKINITVFQSQQYNHSREMAFANTSDTDWLHTGGCTQNLIHYHNHACHPILLSPQRPIYCTKFTEHLLCI